MTREEAISTLKTFRITGDRNHEAFDMAIRSLEAWDDVQKEIYRQIDYLDEIHEYRDRKAYYTALEIINKYLKEVEHDKE